MAGQGRPRQFIVIAREQPRLDPVARAILLVPGGEVGDGDLQARLCGGTQPVSAFHNRSRDLFEPPPAVMMSQLRGARVGRFAPSGPTTGGSIPPMKGPGVGVEANARSPSRRSPSYVQTPPVW